MNTEGPQDATLEELRDDFLGRARSDTVSLLQLCARSADSPRLDRIAHLDDACRLLHRLAGTAGTFGLSEFGLKARDLHRIAKSMAKQPGEEFAERWLSLSEGLREMARVLDAVLPAPEAGEQADSEPVSPGSADTSLLCVLGFERPLEKRICHAFAGFGYVTRVVENVADLAQLLATEEIAGVLIGLRADIEGQLAGLNRLRAMQESPAPLIAVCARGEFRDYLAAARAGVDGYFTDPNDLPRIESRLAFLIERRRRQSLRVLLVDDDLDLLAACKRILRKEGMAVKTTHRPMDVMATLCEFRPDVVVLDIEMPECTGPELAQVIRLNDEWMHVPILYMSGQSEGADMLLATRKAGEAFLAKPIDPRQLVASICAHGRNARQMIETASRDSLTGLLKASFIHDLLDAELERASRTGQPTCAAMIDLDHFKSVNDTHGHQVGDLVIRTIAGVLRQRLRTVDGIGRVGGEEFLVVFSGCGGQEAGTVLADIKRRFAEIAFDGPTGSFHSSFSAGIAECGPGEMSRSELIGLADRALYNAKAAGRNCIELCPHCVAA